MRLMFLFCGFCFIGFINAQEKQYDDTFCRIIRNCAVKDIDVVRYNKDSEHQLNKYDIEYVDFQYFLFMIEYAYRYNDQMAFMYLYEYLSDFYKNHNLKPNSIVLDIIREFRSNYCLEGEIPKDSIEMELKHKKHELKTDKNQNFDFYPVICEVFSSEHVDHDKTSLLYETLYYNTKNMSGPGNKESQLFFLLLVLADQTHEPSAYKKLIESICFFYVGNALKMNDKIFAFIELLTNQIPDSILGATRREYLDSIREYIYKDRNICK